MAQWLVEQTSWAHLLFLAGDVDLISAGPLEDALGKLVAHGHHVVVDCSAVEYLDLRGLESLEAAGQQAQDLGRHLLLIRPSIAVERVFDLGLNGRLQTFPSTEAAARFVNTGS